MNIFQIKTKPHGIERTREFLEEKFICIGWPGIGNLTQISKDEIRNRLKNRYKYYGHELGNRLGHVNAFVNTMHKGDVILITEREWAHIGVVDEYLYEAVYDNEKDGMCHRRKVEWVSRVQINSLNISMQKLLSNRNTICQYSDTFDSSGIEKYLSNIQTISNPSDTRLDDLFQAAIGILEEELKSTDPDRRLKAATELLRFKNNVAANL